MAYQLLYFLGRVPAPRLQTCWAYLQSTTPFSIKGVKFILIYLLYGLSILKNTRPWVWERKWRDRGFADYNT